jgi:Domain of unknown function (DUF397)
LITSDRYRKSSFSGAGSCLEVILIDDDTIGVRDSKDLAKPPHLFTRKEWTEFLAGVKSGEFDL